MSVKNSNTSQVRRTFVLSSGGTGGHLFPAVSLADQIESHGHTCYLVTDNRGAQFFKTFQRKPALICHIQRVHWLFGRLVYPFSLCYQIIRCLVWLLRLKPDGVVGFGGYPSLPSMIAAQILGISTYLHEGNAFLGKANRLLLKRAKKIALSFPPNVTPSNDRWHVTGMPVRKAIASLITATYAPPSEDEPFYILVLGGSQGAKIFGTLVPHAVQLLPFELQNRLVITQQCREHQMNEIKALYKNIPCQKTLKSFLDPIDFYYNSAHFIISRAGASTVAEIAIAGKPALFVPFAASAEGDQARNAEHLQKAEAAWVMREGSITPEKLAELIAHVMTTPKDLQEKSHHVRAFAKPDAALNLWNMIDQDYTSST